MCDGQRKINFRQIMSIAPEITRHIRILPSTPYDNVATGTKEYPFS